jgi:hypothetical protein
MSGNTPESERQKSLLYRHPLAPTNNLDKPRISQPGRFKRANDIRPATTRTGRPASNA